MGRLMPSDAPCQCPEGAARAEAAKALDDRQPQGHPGGQAPIMMRAHRRYSPLSEGGTTMPCGQLASSRRFMRSLYYKIG